MTEVAEKLAKKYKCPLCRKLYIDPETAEYCAESCYIKKIQEDFNRHFPNSIKETKQEKRHVRHNSILSTVIHYCRRHLGTEDRRY